MCPRTYSYTDPDVFTAPRENRRDFWCGHSRPACDACEAVMAQFDDCRVCGAALPEVLAIWARRQMENLTCDAICTGIDLIDRHACCALAKVYPCVCTYSFECPRHGIIHCGTHD